jgi:hypothetical protein
VCEVHSAEVGVELGQCLVVADLGMLVEAAPIVGAGLLHTGDGELQCRSGGSSQPI